MFFSGFIWVFVGLGIAMGHPMDYDYETTNNPETTAFLVTDSDDETTGTQEATDIFITGSEYGTTDTPSTDERTINTCDCGWTLYSGSMYCFFEEEQRWKAAKKTCASLKGSLLQVDSDDENRFIYQSLASSGADSIWLGLTDKAKEGVWVSSDSLRTAKYTNWMGGEPNNYHNQDCAKMALTPEEYQNPGKWDDYACGTKFAFVCEGTLS